MKREMKPYVEGSKSDIRHGKTSYQEGRETKQTNYYNNSSYNKHKQQEQLRQSMSGIAEDLEP
jgi:hypothetical protein